MPMLPIRAATRGSLSAFRTIRHPSIRSPAPLAVTSRPFSQSQVANAGGNDHHYDPPTGWLFGVKPGEQYEKEGWETVFFWGMGGSIVIATIAYAFKPDTSIQTWALEEARRRLEAEGILPDPDKKQE